jgi:2',3'-cyclic-nucleotide 2'-phosphodiesterase (5'-nucleotidase family)
MTNYGYRLMHVLLCGVLLMLQSCHPSWQVAEHTREVYLVRPDAGADSALVRMLAPYKTQLDAEVKTVIGFTDTMLIREQPESTLGNFLADALLSAARKAGYQSDAAIVNYGSLRLPYISPGPLTTGMMFELMPFDNLLVIVEMPGTSLRQFCSIIAAAGGWPVSDIRFVIRDGKATEITVGGKPLDDQATYHIAVNDFMAKGGDNCGMLVSLPQQLTTVAVREILIEYVSALARDGRPLHPVLEKRIRHAE